MGWQSGGVGKSQCTDFVVEVEIVILDVGLTLKVEIAFEYFKIHDGFKDCRKRALTSISTTHE